MEPDGIAVPTPRVAIVDADHRVRQSVADLLRIAGAEIVGDAGDVRSALQLIAEERPDYVLLDPRLPDVEAGAALLKGIRLGWPGIRTIMMGWSDPAEQPELAANISGYVSKSASPEEFLAAVMTACSCEPLDAAEFAGEKPAAR
jgi:DNA-binding NarL/FixJ family response regulator